MAEKSALSKQKQRVQDYMITFNSEHGKKVLHDMMTRFGMLRSSFIKGDSHEMAFMEGQRNVLLFIMHQMKIDMDALNKMIDEGDSYE